MMTNSIVTSLWQTWFNSGYDYDGLRPVYDGDYPEDIFTYIYFNHSIGFDSFVEVFAISEYDARQFLLANNSYSGFEFIHFLTGTSFTRLCGPNSLSHS